MLQLLMMILDDVQKLRPLLDAWEKAGVPGVTILESTGMHRTQGWLARDDLPFVPTLRNLLQVEGINQRTLFALLDDEETLERAVQVACEVIGDFAEPNTGLLFVLPVSRALGLKKRLPPPEEKPAWLSLPETVASITRNTPVTEVEKLSALLPVIVHETDSLRTVAEVALSNPLVRVVCVVDKDERLVGLISLQAVLNDIYLRISPEEFLSDTTDLAQVAEFATRSRVARACDAMQGPVWVKRHETVREVFKKLRDSELEGLPIVDDELHVIGYINITELLAVWLRAEIGRGR
ncbi:MAG: hypothetical protein A2Z04_08415 [Chloroflexi bacterium RBG_16_57_9]|nr:MAG: hypothetical protein A2Z04_08415 [Chloroflexi bacterium RBG_16_57_9]